MRDFKCVTCVTLLALGISVSAASLTSLNVAWANGNTTADAPDPAAAPVKKTVKKAPVKKAPVKKVTTTKKVSTPVKKTPTPLERGIALAQDERYEAAIPLLRAAVQSNPNSAAAWYWYGKCHENVGQFYQAQYFYARAVKCDPTFEPLSRVVVYPEDPSGKTPLWDPKRPARVYSVPTQQQDGTMVVPPDAKGATQLPSRPDIDPTLPRVPSYVPPQPGAMGDDGSGEPWQPAIYVPPARIETIDEGEETAVYMPPEAPRTAQVPQVQLSDLSGFQGLLPADRSYQPPVLDESVQTQGSAPVYQPPLPPEPAKKAEPAPAKTTQKTTTRKTVKTTKKSSSAKNTSKSAPSTQTTQTAIAIIEEQDLDEPKLPYIPGSEQSQQQVQEPEVETKEPQQVQKPETETKKPEPEQPQQRQPSYRDEMLPPVGQGTKRTPDNSMPPPVGQQK